MQKKLANVVRQGTHGWQNKNGADQSPYSLKKRCERFRVRHGRNISLLFYCIVIVVVYCVTWI